MKNCIYINMRHSEESRIIVTDERNKLYGFEQEITGQENIKGDIYKGVISSIETSLEAAFVDLGVDKNGFLPLREISRSYGKVSSGDSVLVQVKKDHSGDKGSGLTTFINLTGNYLVLDTQRGGRNAVSKNLDSATREKILKTITQLGLPENMSVIVRTAALSCSVDELRWDLHSYLLKLWGSIAEVSANEKGPALIYRENNLLLKTVRNYFTPHTESIICDNLKSYNELRQYISLIHPNDLNKVQYHDSNKPMLPLGVEEQISEIYEREIRTPSGIRLVFDSTEAMVTVDVNSARMRRNDNIEETALKANMEAASIIAKQLRLRDLAGLIVVDFIDMSKEANRDKVEEKFTSHLKEDRAQIRHTGISSLGLMEISRQRLSRSLEESHGKSCPHCNGTGRVRHSVVFALQLLRRLRETCPQAEGKKILMQAPVVAAVYLLNKKRVELRRLEDDYNCNIIIVPEKDMLPSDSLIKMTSNNSDSDSELSEDQQKNNTDKWFSRLDTSQPTAMKPLLDTVTPDKSAPVDGFWKKTKKSFAQWLSSENQENPKLRADTRGETLRDGQKHHHSQTKNSSDGERKNNQNRRTRSEQPERKRQEPQMKKRQPAAGDTGGRRSPQGDRYSTNKQRNKAAGGKPLSPAGTQLAGKATTKAPSPVADVAATTAVKTTVPTAKPPAMNAVETTSPVADVAATTAVKTTVPTAKPPAMTAVKTTVPTAKPPAMNAVETTSSVAKPPATTAVETTSSVAKVTAAITSARLADTMKQIETR